MGLGGSVDLREELASTHIHVCSGGSELEVWAETVGGETQACDVPPKGGGWGIGNCGGWRGPRQDRDRNRAGGKATYKRPAAPPTLLLVSEVPCGKVATLNPGRLFYLMVTPNLPPSARPEPFPALRCVIPGFKL